jgi:hypothetical protein
MRKTAVFWHRGGIYPNPVNREFIGHNYQRNLKKEKSFTHTH